MVRDLEKLAHEQETLASGLNDEEDDILINADFDLDGKDLDGAIKETEDEID